MNSILAHLPGDAGARKCAGIVDEIFTKMSIPRQFQSLSGRDGTQRTVYCKSDPNADGVAAMYAEKEKPPGDFPEAFLEKSPCYDLRGCR